MSSDGAVGVGVVRANGRARRRRMSGAVTVAVAVLAVTGLALAVSAGAATETRTYTLAGAIAVGPPPNLTLPSGSTFSATVDTTTGAITNGTMSIPTFLRSGGTPQAYITISQIGTATGSVDPATGTGTLPVSLNVAINVPDLQSVCTLGPVNLSLALAGVSFAAGAGPATITASSFTVPAVVTGAECGQPAADAINAVLGLPTAQTELAFTATYNAPATTTTVAPSTTTTVPTAANAVRATPRYTG